MRLYSSADPKSEDTLAMTTETAVNFKVSSEYAGMETVNTQEINSLTNRRQL